MVKTRNPKAHKRTRPFFPGYLFINVDLAVTGTSELLWIPGSKGVVSFGGTPASVPDQFIHRLKQEMETIDAGAHTRMLQYKDGDLVKICSGPFEGFQAIFNQYLPEQDRVRLLLRTLAENSIYLEVPASQLTSS